MAPDFEPQEFDHFMFEATQRMMENYQEMDQLALALLENGQFAPGEMKTLDRARRILAACVSEESFRSKSDIPNLEERVEALQKNEKSLKHSRGRYKKLVILKRN